MFEILGVIIYGIGIGAWWLLKLSLKFLYYTLPLFFVFFGFFFGGLIGDGCFGSLESDYIKGVKKDFTHQVTIYWDEMETDYTTIYVREDLNWCLNGSGSVNYSDDLYQVDNYTDDQDLLPDKAEKTGFVFKGLFDASFGNGTQYVTEKGYSLVRITEDVELYAYWEEA